MPPAPLIETHQTGRHTEILLLAKKAMERNRQTRLLRRRTVTGADAEMEMEPEMATERERLNLRAELEMGKEVGNCD